MLCSSNCYALIVVVSCWYHANNCRRADNLLAAMELYLITYVVSFQCIPLHVRLNCVIYTGLLHWVWPTPCQIRVVFWRWPRAMQQERTSTSSSAKWVVKFKEDDRVHHKKTGRQGTVVSLCDNDPEGWMVVKFDQVQRKGVHGWGGLFDDEEKPRKKLAFNLGENGLPESTQWRIHQTPKQFTRRLSACRHVAVW